MRVIAEKRFSPVSTYTTITTSFDTVDAPNLVVDFSTSAASSVLVQATMQIGFNGLTYLIVGFRDGSGAVVGSKRNMTGSSDGITTVAVRDFMAYQAKISVTPTQNYRWYLSWALGSALGDTGKIYNATDSSDESEVIIQVLAEE